MQYARPFALRKLYLMIKINSAQDVNKERSVTFSHKFL